MQTLSLIQISDLHYPEEILAASRNTDWKDDAFPRRLGDAISTPRLQSVMRELLGYLDMNKSITAGIIICGDLTSEGNIDGYSNSLKYLNETLQLATKDVWQEDQVHVVPGNHDINRDKCDPNGDDLFQKFDQLVIAWHNIGLPILTARDVRQTQVSANGHSLDVFSINSCIGCGEQRSMPSKVKEQINKLLKEIADPHLIWEQLDTPAFLEADVNKVSKAISRLSGLSVGLVVAHHNLLPQVLPRIQIYTEVINGGLVRSRFSQSGHPVIYCHGHVHDDPVEMIINPRAGGDRLISIACPKFSDGFNVIKLHYSRSEVPIGCTVVPYRFQTDSSVKPQDIISIPLRSNHDSARIMDDLTKTILSCITKDWARFSDVHEKVEIKEGHKPHKKTLAHALQELKWLGYLDILDSDEEAAFWQLKRIEP